MPEGEPTRDLHDPRLTFLAGDSEMAALMRAKDWSATPLGPPDGWSLSVKTAVSICLNSHFPTLLWLGPELRLVYNDAYIPFLGGAKHPAVLGEPGWIAWGEIWPLIGPMHEEVRAGRATTVDHQQMFFNRHLPREEVYVTFGYSPIFAEDGQTVEGTFCACTETTDKIVGERRLATLDALCARRAEGRTVEAACQDATDVLEGNPLDIPFAAIYLLDEQGTAARRVAGTRLPPNPAAFPPIYPLGDGASQPWPLAQVAETRGPVEIDDVIARIGVVAAGHWPDAIETALILPLTIPNSSEPTDFLIVGISPRRVLDAGYRGFLHLTAGHIATIIGDARAFEAERRRAEVLAEIDRAKTTFFSNVSHEFRTPLTLMLGPLEEVLAHADDVDTGEILARIEVAHRNGLRLMKLVNALLDFARVEAGRSQARYAPTDLAAYSGELASSFRSTIERAGLRLIVDTPPLSQPVYVDRHMWETIVLNLLSNAFKFTFRGEIAVELREADGGAVLRVRDTGIGIAAHELPHLFDRFHRVEGASGRSYEGSGIGLALVQELARQHGGQMTVESEPGRGSLFTVTILLGTAHLPADKIVVAEREAAASPGAQAYVEEALRSLSNGVASPVDSPEVHHERVTGVGAGASILLADDNADMRDYLRRLLADHGYAVEVATDGKAALEALREHRPDLLLTDVMMPRLNGIELLQAVRRDPELRDLLVIFLSARAGEEARLEGLSAGADDYLIKPFSARELLARVDTNLSLVRLRREMEDRLRDSETRLKAATDLVGLSSYTWNPATGALEWDARLKAMWGLPVDAHVDCDLWLSAIHPEDRPRVEAAVAACTDPAGDGFYRIEYRVIGIEDKVERWVSTYGRTSFEDRRPVSFIGAVLDITGRKRVEQALRASEELFRQFAEHLVNVLWITDVTTGRIEYLSPAFERIWGVPRQAMLRHWSSWIETIHPDDRAVAETALQRAQAGEVCAADYRLLRPDGAVRCIRDTFFPIRDDQGNIRRIAGIAQDVTPESGRRIYLVAPDEILQSLRPLLRDAGYEVKAFKSVRSLREVASVLAPGCVLLVLGANAVKSFGVLSDLKLRRAELPVIVVDGPHSDIELAVSAMRAGALDFLPAHQDHGRLLHAVASALVGIQDAAEHDRFVVTARARIAELSVREREVLEKIVAGGTNKTIARELGLSPRTIEVYRARVMERLGASTVQEAVLMAAAAGLSSSGTPTGQG